MSDATMAAWGRLGQDPKADNLVLDEIRSQLDLAHDHDVAALEARRNAGRLLVGLRERLPRLALQGLVRGLGLDPMTLQMLIDMAAGGAERSTVALGVQHARAASPKDGRIPPGICP